MQKWKPTVSMHIPTSLYVSKPTCSTAIQRVTQHVCVTGFTAQSFARSLEERQQSIASHSCQPSRASLKAEHNSAVVREQTKLCFASRVSRVPLGNTDLLCCTASDTASSWAPAVYNSHSSEMALRNSLLRIQHRWGFPRPPQVLLK